MDGCAHHRESLYRESLERLCACRAVGHCFWGKPGCEGGAPINNVIATDVVPARSPLVLTLWCQGSLSSKEGVKKSRVISMTAPTLDSRTSSSRLPRK
eukprot:scaffold156406_cov106-Attheya_sp.AAC.1